jgi:hypothetical protein
MVPLKPTRAASHRDAHRTPGRFGASAPLRSRSRGERAADQRQGWGKLQLSRWPRPDRVERLSVHTHGLASGAARVCMFARPPRRPDAPHYVLRPAGFIGHCNVRSSLNVAGEFRTSKKYRLSLKTLGLRTRTALLVHLLICRINSATMAVTNKCLAQHNKSCTGPGPQEVDLPMNGGQPSCSDLPISDETGMNPSHHGSDEQMFGAKQQVLGTVPSD